MRLLLAIFPGIFCLAAGQDDTDRCLLPFQAGPCRATKFVVKFDQETGACLPAVYGGCGGNENRFSGISECEKVCSKHLKKKFEVLRPECSDPPLVSDKSCMGIFPRYRYDVETGRCEKYMYGGCNGSKNLYLTEIECISTCIRSSGVQAPTTRLKGSSGDAIQFPGAPKSGDQRSTNLVKLDEDICSLPPVLPGPLACLAHQPMWTHSHSEGGCVPYSYGGCRGTENLFKTEAECQQKCGNKDLTKSADVCQQNIQPGPCRGHFPVFGFNKVTGRCENFIFGGCKGNDNRWESLEECVGVCGGNEPDITTDCRGVKCDVSHINYQQSKGCSPITKPGECCPSSWDCSAWEDRLRNKDKCFSISPNNPRGRLYNKGVDMETYFGNGCTAGCFCEQGSDGLADPVCAVVDCFFPPEDDGQKCAALYESAGHCCASEFKCGEDLEELGGCFEDGAQYKFGEKYYPKDDPCKVCLCKPFDGTDTCEPIDCGYHYSIKMIQGCVPVFAEGQCCPASWVCPAEQDLLDNQAVAKPGSQTVKPQDRCILPPSPQEDCSETGFRYFFDKSSGRCERFEGCEGSNDNNFASQEECNSACKDLLAPPLPRLLEEERQYFQAKDQKCEKKVQIGKCRSRLRKYFYDVTTGKCHEFFYSGCQGGENMFDTLRDCVSTCVSPSSMLRRPVGDSAGSPPPAAEVDPCTLDKSVGPCRAMRPRYFYDQASATCQKFLFGGCQGNGNNFPDEDSCLEKCKPGSLLGAPMAAGFPCLGCPKPSLITPELQQVAENAVDLMKESLQLLGVTDDTCDNVELLVVMDASTQVVAGTNYVFKLKVESKAGDKCDVSKEVFICENVKIFKPLPVYCEDENGDCSELSNVDEINCYPEISLARFISPDEEINTVPDIDPCLQSKEIGPCKAAFPRFFFDSDTKSCQKFNYGGCRGNENNFAAKSDCESKCGQFLESPAPRTSAPGINPAGNPVCKLPMDAGYCYALKPRYFYNTATNKCEQFLYGGCRGNENNFESEEDCISTCDKPQGRRRGPPRSLLLESSDPVCKVGNDTFAVGDIVRIDDNPCKACVCSSPPEISCFEKTCPLIAPVSRDNEDCVIVKDDLGCCQERLDCPPPAIPDIIVGGGGGPGGFPIAGGFGSASISPEIKKIAALTAKQHLVTVAEVTGAACEEATLLEILDASSQVVAGTNYRLTLKLRAKSGPFCQDTLDRYCKNIIVHKPLPFRCQGDDILKCLSLIREDEIRCFETKDQLMQS